MTKKQKLEITWIGKENRPKLKNLPAAPLDKGQMTLFGGVGKP